MPPPAAASTDSVGLEEEHPPTHRKNNGKTRTASGSRRETRTRGSGLTGAAVRGSRATAMTTSLENNADRGGEGLAPPQQLAEEEDIVRPRVIPYSRVHIAGKSEGVCSKSQSPGQVTKPLKTLAQLDSVESALRDEQCLLERRFHLQC
jgi:hypothetical protein